MFVKRPDPHEEALRILQGHMSHAAAASGSQVRGTFWLGPVGTEDKAGPWSLSEISCPYKLLPLPLPPSQGPPEHSFVVGTGAQRGRGLGKAGDQHTKAIHGTHTR